MWRWSAKIAPAAALMSEIHHKDIGRGEPAETPVPFFQETWHFGDKCTIEVRLDCKTPFGEVALLVGLADSKAPSGWQIME